jgi:radical SAM protein with 4Fe4S-binding SPASM domain
MREKSEYKPRVIMQIIDLEEFDMADEIKKFQEYWADEDVEVQVWDELTWGIKEPREKANFRYPCLSLWNSFTINSDGLVSACCMDWNESLITGDIKIDSIEKIWKGMPLADMRKAHLDDNYKDMELCKNCDYWKWQAKLKRYEL